MRASPSITASMSASTVQAQELADKHDALLLAMGAEHPRDAGLPGTDVAGVH